MGSSGGIRFRRRVGLVLLLLVVASLGGTARAREAQPLPEAAAAVGTRRAPERHGLALDFYAKTCPAVDQIVANVTAARYRDFPAAGPAVLRLFHHDCFVEVRRRDRQFLFVVYTHVLALCETSLICE
jgi:peroxidase